MGGGRSHETAGLLSEEPARQRGRGVRWLSGLIVAMCAVVVVCSAAASTRPAEYEAFSGFVAREHRSMGERALVPSMLRARHPHLAQLRSLEGQENEDRRLTPEEVDERAKQWAANHPEESSHIYMTTLTGIVVALLGIVFLVTSEMNTVNLVRDLDNLQASGEPKSVEIEEREELWGGGMGATWRPWLSLGGVGLMMVGGIVMLAPMCQVLEDFGLPEAANSADCITSVLLIAVVGAVGWGCLIAALIWACTRPWASLLLASISLGAHVTTGVASPILILLWAVTSGLLAYYYLQDVPESRPDYNPREWRRVWFGGGGGSSRSPGRPTSAYPGPITASERESMSTAYV